MNKIGIHLFNNAQQNLQISMIWKSLKNVDKIFGKLQLPTTKKKRYGKSPLKIYCSVIVEQALLTFFLFKKIAQKHG